MKKYLTLIAILTYTLLISCSYITEPQNQSQTEMGSVQFQVNATQASSAALLTTTSTLNNLHVTIKDQDNIVVYNRQSIPLLKLGDSYLTTPLSLSAGTYTITEYFAINNSNEISYITPITGSVKAPLVTQALPMTFTVSGSDAINVNPEVIAAEQHAAVYGYSFLNIQTPQALLTQNKLIWDAATIDQYTFTNNVDCFCFPEEDIVIRVDSGHLVSAVYTPSDQPVSDARRQQLHSIDSYFTLIQDALDANAYSVDVSYDSTLGYPTRISIDYDHMIADDERVYTLSAFSH